MNTTLRPLRIAVADDQLEMRKALQALLFHLGHEVVTLACNGRELVESCRALHPELVVSDIRMAELDGLQAAAEINRNFPTPVVLITGFPEADLSPYLEADYVMACRCKPFKPADLQADISLAVLRFRRFQAMREEATRACENLEHRKVAERAKGIVMKRLRLDEEEAHHRLTRLACDTRRKLMEIAQDLFAADQIFQALEKSGEPRPSHDGARPSHDGE